MYNCVKNTISQKLFGAHPEQRSKHTSTDRPLKGVGLIIMPYSSAEIKRSALVDHSVRSKELHKLMISLNLLIEEAQDFFYQ